MVYATTMDVRGQVTLQVPASFHYAFGGLPDWSYLVVAGTDADNDGSIWDEGEPLSGIYPSIEAPVALAVTAGNPVRSIDFPLQPPLRA